MNARLTAIIQREGDGFFRLHERRRRQDSEIDDAAGGLGEVGHCWRTLQDRGHGRKRVVVKDSVGHGLG